MRNVYRTSVRRGMLRKAVFPVMFAVSFLPSFDSALAQNAPATDVVIVVDTAARRQPPAADLQRASTLATMLLADLVPGHMAIVRPLDVDKDASVIPSQRPEQIEKCRSNPAVECRRVVPANDWYGKARAQKFGVLVRGNRSDPAFKEQLSRHLAPVNSSAMTGLALRGAQGEFDSLGGAVQGRMLVWLIAGDADDPDQVQAAATELAHAGVAMEALTLGNAAVPLPNDPSRTSRQIRTSRELMKASASIFRRIVGAPYEIDNEVAVHPSFEMKPAVDEAWIVVYGDENLDRITIETPNGPQVANYAHGQQPGIGAYRVFHVEKPVPGQWSVRVDAGGRAAYSVVERSDLTPVVLEPRTAPAGVPVLLVARLGASGDGPPLACQNSPDGIVMEAEIQGRKVPMVDDGTHGDKVARDGSCSAMVTFDEVGEIPVILRAHGPLLDQSVRVSVTVTGMFRATAGGPLTLDLGSFGAPGQSCREFHIAAEQQGVLPFEIVPAQQLPVGYRFELHQARGVFVPGQRMPLGPGEPLQLCLLASSNAASFTGKEDRWLDVRLAGSTSPDAVVPVRGQWVVHGPTWWKRHHRTMFILMALIVFLIAGCGYVQPRRFPRSLAIEFGSQRNELDQQAPQSVSRTAGTGVGWYRDARACLHRDFRLNGRRAGAVAILTATASGTLVQSGEGGTLYRETVDGTWEPLPAEGRRAGGEVYRSGETGPFFRISRG